MEFNNEKIITMDKNILLSIININKEILDSRLSELNYFYNEKFNQYVWSD